MKVGTVFLVFLTIVSLAGSTLAGEMRDGRLYVERQKWDQQVYNPQTGEMIPIYQDESVRSLDHRPIQPDEKIACSDGQIYCLVPVEERLAKTRPPAEIAPAKADLRRKRIPADGYDIPPQILQELKQGPQPRFGEVRGATDGYIYQWVPND